MHDKRRRPKQRPWFLAVWLCCVLSGFLIMLQFASQLASDSLASKRRGGHDPEMPWRAVPGPDAAEGPAGDGYFGLPFPNALGDFPGYPRRELRYGRDFNASFNVTEELLFAHNASEYQPPADRLPALKYPPLVSDMYLTVSVRPRILLFPRIITDDEADLIRNQALRNGITRSEVRPTGQQRRGGKSSARTSMGTFLRTDSPLWMRRIRDRLINVTGISYSERLQVLRYEEEQHYRAHNDYFDPERYGTQKNNRAATFFLYLADMEYGAGGETSWPRAGGGPAQASGKWRNDDACRTGLQVVPRKGAGALFYNMRPDGRLDPHAVHAGCDVRNGTKWAAPLWFRVPKPLYREDDRKVSR